MDDRFAKPGASWKIVHKKQLSSFMLDLIHFSNRDRIRSVTRESIKFFQKQILLLISNACRIVACRDREILLLLIIVNDA